MHKSNCHGASPPLLKYGLHAIGVTPALWRGGSLVVYAQALGIVWKKSDVYQTLAEVDHDNSGTVGLEEFINLTTALVTEADLDRTNGNFDALFAKFDHGGDGYVDLAKLRFVCRELGEQLGSGSEQADDQLREMLKHASKDGSGERVTKDELYDCLAKTRLM